MYWFRKTFGKFWPFILIILMVTVFFIVTTREESLNVYNGGNASYTVTPETELDKNITTKTYKNSRINFTMQIPDDWTYITKDGYDTYVHGASASSIQIQVLSYYPMVNNASYESLSAAYANRGLELTEFEFLSSNSYYLIYKENGLSGITDYIETVIWDRQHVVKVVVTFNDSYYERLQDDIWYCVDSISWEYEDPIPSDFYLYYQLYGDFEYAIPLNWNVGNTENSIYAYEESTGASLTVNVLEDTTSLDDISQIDYSNFMSNGRSNFVLTQFKQTENSLYGEATFVQNDVQMSMLQEYYANGKHHYILTYEFPIDLGVTYGSIFSNALKLTRIYETVPSEIQETEEDIFTPETSWNFEEKSKPESQKETEANQLQKEKVATLAEALISVAGISQDNAETVENKWQSINAGTPIYAEVMKEDPNLIIMVTSQEGTNYYVSFNSEGSFQDIRVGSENGPKIN